MRESPGERERRSGWLWFWLVLFAALILLLLIWAWPARQPPADGPNDVSVTRVEVRAAPAATVVA